MTNSLKSGRERNDDYSIGELSFSKKQLRILFQLHLIVSLVGEGKLKGSIRQFEKIWYRNTPSIANPVLNVLKEREVLLPVNDSKFKVDLTALENFIISLPEFRDVYCFVWKLQRTIIPDLCGNTREYLRERTGFFLDLTGKIGLLN